MSGKKQTLYDVAKVLRSKNAGPFCITLDILFDDDAIYKSIKERNIITQNLIAKLYGISIDKVEKIIYFDNALGIKITIARSISSGSPLDTDVYGAQQHAPLMNLPV